MFHRRLYIGLFTLSFSLLLFELTLIRVYSATLFYHFAFMAISVAMLGLAAAGLTVHLYPGYFLPERLDRWTRRWSAVYAVSVMVVLWIVFRIPVNAYLPPNQIAWKLTAIYLLSAVPFYSAGLVFSGLFAALPHRIGGLYAWDLVGAGLGALGIILLMNLTGGESAVFYIAACGFLAAGIFAAPGHRTLPIVLAAIVVVMGLSNPSVGWLRILYSKGMSLRALEVHYNRWNSFSRVMAIPFRPGTDAVYTWCPSPNYPLPIMEHMSLMIDDGAATPVLPFDGENLDRIDYLKYDLTSFGHRLRGNGETLIIGSGGGRDVLTALLFGAERIDAVDVNPLIFEAMDGPLAKFAGDLYHHPRVKGIVAEGRAYARRHPGQYDHIQIAMIDTWAATTAGAYSLSENSLYTVEAFEDYLRGLKPGGIISLTRFFFYPPRQALRLVSIYLEAAERLGVANPDSCILVGKYETLSTLLFKREPFTPAEIQQFKEDLNDLGFYLVYAPDERPDRIFMQLVEIDDRDIFYRKYPFAVNPPDDDRPFFFNMLKMRDFMRVFEIREGQRFNYYATYTLMVVLLLSVAATLVVLVLPVVLRGIGSGRFQGRWGLLFYFVGIGLAYIMVEVVLLQRFVLLLEHPAYAASGVVAGMLVSSGIGSMIWGRSSHTSRRLLLNIGFGVIGAGLLFHALLGGAVIQQLIHLPVGLKAMAAAVMVVPLGMAMGIPLPVGVTVAGGRGEGTVAWCWALNGAAAVVASSLAVALAMAYGFASVLAAGLVCYVIAYSLMMGVVLKRGGLPVLDG